MTKPAQDAVRPIGRLFKIAVSAGIESAVKLHIGRGDNLECRDEKGLTPLMIAASARSQITPPCSVPIGFANRAMSDTISNVAEPGSASRSLKSSRSPIGGRGSSPRSIR